MSFAIHMLENPSGTEIDEMVKLCLRAYNQEEISVKTLAGGDVGLLNDFFCASLRAGALGGKICVATEAGNDGNVIRGMALWWPPGAEPFSQS
ncbi:hypothetical protein FB45DRAFT_1027760 [Roridomyces roridus]|uniref:Uncharacterized protein n=1 Tax=Roridomyces roridus TaxID=1738132 RepID=A0AAD7BTM2_9AGAR|nr:hypothetical protein FB45DRAFT_1027760 [Roridomyces roridus]